MKVLKRVFTVLHEDITQFDILCNSYLNKGYIPTENVTVFYDGRMLHFVQQYGLFEVEGAKPENKKAGFPEEFEEVTKRAPKIARKQRQMKPKVFETHKCENPDCGKEFQRSSKKAKFCEIRCRNSFHNNKQKEIYKEKHKKQ